MPDELFYVNCATGQRIRRELTSAETTQRANDTTEDQRIRLERDTDDTSRQAVLVKLAQAAGVTVPELRKALGR